MPVTKKKLTTLTSEPSMSEPFSPVLPEQQVFHQHLRRLAQSAVRIVIETVMREELDAFIGAAWGESTPKRKGYRKGTYTRDLVTSNGRLEDIKVPRDRECQFHTWRERPLHKHWRILVHSSHPYMANIKTPLICGRFLDPSQT